jgi:cyclic beta-1,2-glucan synthetase
MDAGPWVNVIANPSFGFQVSESGSGYTWSENSRENQLTPWSNDPVSDPPGEAIYVRDDDTGECGAQPPCRSADRGVVLRRAPRRRDTAGSSTCSTGIRLDLSSSCRLDDSVKVSVLDHSRTAMRAAVAAAVGDRLRRVGSGNLRQDGAS